MGMRVVLDLDDFSVLRNRMDLLLQIKEHYPNFKVSMFTIPFDYEYETSMLRLQREEALQKIKDNLDWIQIIPHGLTHMPREFENADKQITRMALASIDEAFKKDGLPYEKGFKAPFWLWNQDVVDVLNEEGWWGAQDRNQPENVRTNRFYEYTHSIDEPFWNVQTDLLKLHGHISLPSANNLEDCLLNIFKLPADVQWCFATEFLEDKV